MKKIVFVQVGFAFDGSAYLPYAAGTMIANCLKDPALAAEYDFSQIIYRREKLADALQKTEGAYLVAFSCSVWNMEYNKALSRRLKRRDPACITVFGGHSVSMLGELLEEEPSVDYLLLGEGEESFAELLRRLPDGTADETPGIAFRKDGKPAFSAPAPLAELAALPSPYLTHVFDRLMADAPGQDFLAVLETNRGCPYRCAYCDWVCAHKMRFFPMEKVLGEIEWLSEHRIAYCFCADSNFGMFERDVEIADALIRAKKATGYPQVFRPCYEKNSADRVFRICSALNSVGMDKGATLAYQTLSPDALANIGRTNLTMEHFSALVKRYIEAGIPTYSELILGLPGETRESFCRGICRLLESGQHNSLSVYHCEVLPNAELAAPAFIEKYGIEVMKVAFNHIHSAPEREDEVPEYSYLVRATATMSREDWVYANLFSVCVQCFHSLGVLRFFALYLHANGLASYMDFYTRLLEHILASAGKLSALWRTFRARYETSLAGDWNYHREAFGNVTWFFEEGAFLELIADPGLCMRELAGFLRGFGIHTPLFEELAVYQDLLLRKPFEEPRTQTFSYDFDAYFTLLLRGEPAELEKRPVSLTVTPRRRYGSLPEYAKEVVWFGRRRGDTVYHRDEIRCDPGEAAV